MSAIVRAMADARNGRRFGDPPVPARERLYRARMDERSSAIGWTWEGGELPTSSVFTIMVKIYDDTDSSSDDDDVFGEFVTDAEPGVTVESPRRYAPSWAQTDPYYRPAWSIADRCAYWRSQGAPRAVARVYAVKGAEGEALEACEREFHGVEVTALHNGEPVGSASLWGCDGGPAYLMDVAMDLAPEAVSDGWRTIERRYGPNGRQLFLTSGVAA